jgi:hypothetical protein
MQLLTFCIKQGHIVCPHRDVAGPDVPERVISTSELHGIDAFNSCASREVHMCTPAYSS